MIHYNIWFSLREPASEADVVALVNEFLTDQVNRDEIAGFTLLRNRATGANTTILPLGALVVFRDAAQFARAFQEIARLGVHSGMHGAMAKHVSAFQAETFDVIDVGVGLQSR